MTAQNKFMKEFTRSPSSYNIPDKVILNQVYTCILADPFLSHSWNNNTMNRSCCEMEVKYFYNEIVRVHQVPSAGNGGASAN